jgi:N-acetylmuramoyl-L-alanine amidase
MTIKDGLYDKASMAPSQNKGGYIKPRLIIVHDTAGGLDAAGSIAWLRNPQAKASAHFVVSREGAVTQLVSCNLKAWHAGKSSYHGVANVNDFAVGIEIVNPGELQPSGPASARASFGAVFENKKYDIQEVGPVENLIYMDGKLKPILTHSAALWMPYTQAQLDAVLSLCLDLKDAYGITEVVPHWYIAPKRKVDTNPLFPLRWLQGKLAGRSTDTPLVEVPTAHPPLDTPITDADPMVIPVKYVNPTSFGKVREWPSFHKENILTVPDGHGPLRVIGEGTFFITGEGLDDEMAGVILPWYKVEVTFPNPSETKTAFLLKSSAEVV